ncbi:MULTISPECIES: sulfotransferase family 2 domain-containing protein [Rhodobacterales]|uniref:sulfotransferase family 2 domain-containing protein n=1 Tax=Rhodobacterales TaxID=204455 RepID=UPI003272DCB1
MPLIDWNGKRILYIHVPKTGGTSIETWLSTLAPLQLHTIGQPTALRCTPQHLQYKEITALLAAGSFDYAFMSVRNPFARLASEYRMRAQAQQEGFWGAVQKFPYWLETSLNKVKRDPFVLDNHMRPQWEFTGNDVEVFRLEDGLETMLAQVADKIGAPVPEITPHKMNSQSFQHDVTWERADVTRVQQFYAADFTEFDYPTALPGPKARRE